MNDGKNYDTASALALLLIGEPGTGKTSTCFEWPDPWFLDTDGKLKNGIERNPGKTFYWDSCEQDEAGKPVPPHLRWQRAKDLIAKAGTDARVKTIVIDGLGRLSDYLQATIIQEGGMAEKPLIIGGEKQMTMSLWLPFSRILKEFIFGMRGYKKPVIMTCHVKIDENELTTVKEQRPDLSGQLASSLAKLFTDYWMTCAEPTTNRVNYPSGVRYYLRTMPTNRIKLVNSCGLPPEVETSDAAFKALVAKMPKAAAAPASTTPVA